MNVDDNLRRSFAWPTLKSNAYPTAAATRTVVGPRRNGIGESKESRCVAAGRTPAREQPKEAAIWRFVSASAGVELLGQGG